MIILDIIQALTGYNIIEEVKEFVTPHYNIERMNPDDENFQNYKNTIKDDYVDLIFPIFNDLGELDLKKI